MRCAKRIISTKTRLITLPVVLMSNGFKDKVMKNIATKRIDEEYAKMVVLLMGALDDCEAGDNKRVKMLQDRRQWAIDRAKEYAKVLGERWEDVLGCWEMGRYKESYYKYYTSKRFPAIAGRTVMTETRWKARGFKLYGKIKTDWKFRCPACGHVQSARDIPSEPYDKNDIFTTCFFDSEGREECGYSSKNNGSACKLIVVTDIGYFPHEIFEFAD